MTDSSALPVDGGASVAFQDDGLVIRDLVLGAMVANAVRLQVDAGREPTEVVTKMLEVGALVLEHGAQSALADTVVAAIRAEFDTREQVASVVERSSLKGLAFEELVGAALEQAFAPFGDEVHATGNVPGADGRNKRGDFVVTLSPESIGGPHRRIVVEVKDSLNLQLGGATGALSYLADAVENRSGDAGVLVCSSSPRGLAGHALRWYAGNRIVVVLDKAEPELLPLHTACGLARALAASTRGGGDAFDRALIAERVGQLQGVLDAARGIKQGTRAARKGLDTIEQSYAALAADANVILEEIRDRLEESE